MSCFEEYKDLGLFGHSGTIMVSDATPEGLASFLLPSCSQLYSPLCGELWLNWCFGLVQSLRLRDWILKLQLTPLQWQRPCAVKPMHRSALARCFCTISMFIHSFSTVLATNCIPWIAMYYCSTDHPGGGKQCSYFAVLKWLKITLERAIQSWIDFSILCLGTWEHFCTFFFFFYRL